MTSLFDTTQQPDICQVWQIVVKMQQSIYHDFAVSLALQLMVKLLHN